MPAPLAPPRLSLPRNVEADAQAVETSLGDGQPRFEDPALVRGGVLRIDQLVIDGGYRVLPQELLGGDLRAEVARDRPHVAVRQLEPRPGEGVGELVRVLMEAPRDGLVDRVHAQREVRGQHDRGVPLRRIVGVRHGAGAGAVRRHPTTCCGR